jgi:putative phosphoribosyl transferase
MKYVMSLILELALYLNVPQRLLKFRGSSHYQIDDKIVVLIDDGVCTGISITMVATWARSQYIKKLIIATPLAPKDALQKLKEITDMVVVLHASLECYCEPAAEFCQNFPEVKRSGSVRDNAKV